MAKMHTLTDDFTTADGTKWLNYGSGPTIDTGRLALPMPSPSYPSLVSATADWDLTESSMTLQLVRVPNLGTTSIGVFAELRNAGSASDYVRWDWSDSGLVTAVRAGVVVGSSVAYTAGMWVRIRMVSGTIFWDWSLDGLSWTNTGSWVSTFAFTATEVRLYAGYWNGADPVPTPTPLLDNFNLPPSGGPTAKAGTDSSTLAESAALQRTSSSTDTLTLTEAAAGLQRASALADTATLAEAAQLLVILDRTDTGTLAEAATGTATLDDTDTSTLTEGTAGLALTATDTATLAETATSTATLTAADIGTLAEASTLNAGGNATANDSATLAEASALEAVVAGVDQALLAEAAQLLVILDRTDTAALAEGPPTGIATLAAADAGQLLEAASLGADATLSAVDGAALAEASALLVALGLADAHALLEQPAEISALLAAADTATLADVSELLAGLTRADDAALAEASTLAVALAVADGATVAEQPVGLTATLTRADSAVLAEASALLMDTRLTAADVALLSEASSLRIVAGELVTPGVMTTGYGPRTYMIGGQQ